MLETIGTTRRGLLKGSAALAGTAASGALFAPAAHAAKTIKLGYVSPRSGPLAAFAEADDFVIRGFLETVKGGLALGKGSYPVEVVVKDSQSDPNRAAAVAKDLIVQDKVDLMLVA
jgi:branched-chain amino acid transport system substrate-binding protein